MYNILECENQMIEKIKNCSLGKLDTSGKRIQKCGSWDFFYSGCSDLINGKKNSCSSLSGAGLLLLRLSR
jgi:hypothetical protein